MNTSDLLASLLTPLTNRGSDGQFTLPADGWYHGLPKGEFPHTEKLPDGTIRRALQVIDDQALTAMQNSFEIEAARPNFPGLLVDFDHFSGDDDKPSEAAGWISGWKNDARGAWWQIRWTDVGDGAVKNGRYRFISGEFLPKDCQFIEGPLKNAAAKTIEMKVRPLRLAGAGLTNKPNLRGMVPLSNRQGQDDLADNQQQTKKPTMNRIASFLGLSAEASEDSILAELTKLKNRTIEAETGMGTFKIRVNELSDREKALEAENKKLNESRVNAAVEKFKNRVKADKLDSLKNRLTTDYDGTIELLESMTAAAAVAPGRIVNREKLGAPTGDETTGGRRTGAEHPFVNRAKEIAKEQKISEADAMLEAAKEDPELYREYNQSFGLGPRMN